MERGTLLQMRSTRTKTRATKQRALARRDPLFVMTSTSSSDGTDTVVLPHF
jgi:hypothetical protein